jgi:hypothetical protein
VSNDVIQRKAISLRPRERRRHFGYLAALSSSHFRWAHTELLEAHREASVESYRGE